MRIVILGANGPTGRLVTAQPSPPAMMPSR
jgi:hypothetical protein